MKNFRSFLTESKEILNPGVHFEDTPPRESRLETEFRLSAWKADSTQSYMYGTKHQLPERELPHRVLHVANDKIGEGWVDSGAEIKHLPSKSTNFTPANKKFKIVSTHVVHHTSENPYSPGHPIQSKVTEVAAPSGAKYTYVDRGSYGDWYKPDGSRESSMTIHNHLRIHEPSMFPPRKENPNFFSTELQDTQNGKEHHHIFIGSTEPFSAVKHKNWDHMHKETQGALHRAVHQVNANAAKYGVKPYKVTAVYDGQGSNRNAIHLSNGKETAVLHHEKRSGGSTKTLYNQHGKSYVSDDSMTAHAKVFGFIK